MEQTVTSFKQDHRTPEVLSEKALRKLRSLAVTGHISGFELSLLETIEFYRQSTMRFRIQLDLAGLIDPKLPAPPRKRWCQFYGFRIKGQISIHQIWATDKWAAEKVLESLPVRIVFEVGLQVTGELPDWKLKRMTDKLHERLNP